MGSEDGSVRCLEILGQTLYRRMLKKDGSSQIQLVGLIEAIGKGREGNRIKAVFWEGSLGIDVLNPDFEQVGNHERQGLTQLVRRNSARCLSARMPSIGNALNRAAWGRPNLSWRCWSLKKELLDAFHLPMQDDHLRSSQGQRLIERLHSDL